MSDLLRELFAQASKDWIEDYTEGTTGSLKPWTKTSASEFARTPVETLVRDPYFLGFEDHLYPGVIDDILELWELRKRKDINIHTFVDEEAIGSGKTSKTSIIIWLLWFEVSMHLNPQEYYNLHKDSTIAFICLSRSEAQSRRVIFSDVWKRFRCPFNLEYFPPIPRMRREIVIARNNTVVYAGTSSALSALGYNLFGGVVDEKIKISHNSSILTLNGSISPLDIFNSGRENEALNLWSFNTETGLLEPSTAKGLIKKAKSDEIYRIELEDGNFIEATANHPFLVRSDLGLLMYKKVKDLKLNDDILDVKGIVHG